MGGDKGMDDSTGSYLTAPMLLKMSSLTLSGSLTPSMGTNCGRVR